MNCSSSHLQTTSTDKNSIGEPKIEKNSIPLSKHHRKGDASVSVPEHTISDPSSMMLSTAEKISDVGISTVDSGKQYESQLRLSFTPESWIFETGLLGLQGMTASLVNQTELVSVNRDEVVLASNSHTEGLLNELHRQRISEAFSKHLGNAPKIVVEIREILGETPESHRARIKSERLALAKKKFGEDSFVKALTERFNASIPTETIQPRDGDNHV